MTEKVVQGKGHPRGHTWVRVWRPRVCRGCGRGHSWKATCGGGPCEGGCCVSSSERLCHRQLMREARRVGEYEPETEQMKGRCAPVPRYGRKQSKVTRWLE